MNLFAEKKNKKKLLSQIALLPYLMVNSLEDFMELGIAVNDYHKFIIRFDRFY